MERSCKTLQCAHFLRANLCNSGIITRLYDDDRLLSDNQLLQNGSLEVSRPHSSPPQR